MMKKGLWSAGVMLGALALVALENGAQAAETNIIRNVSKGGTRGVIKDGIIRDHKINTKIRHPNGLNFGPRAHSRNDRGWRNRDNRDNSDNSDSDRVEDFEAGSW